MDKRSRRSLRQRGSANAWHRILVTEDPMAKSASKRTPATRRSRTAKSSKRKSPTNHGAKHEVGAFFRVPLPDGAFGYGRHLDPPYSAFYDFRTTEPMSDLDVIESKSVLSRLPHVSTNVDGFHWVRGRCAEKSQNQ